MQETCATHQAISEEEVLHGRGPVQGRTVGVVNVEIEEVGDVVLEVLAHAREVLDHWHSDLLEVLFGAYPGEQKDLGRVDCS